MLKFLLFLIALNFSACAVVNVNLENDVFAGTDENFTNGFGLTSTVHKSGGHDDFKELPDFVKGIYKNIPLVDIWDDFKYGRKIWQFGVRQDMYTPTDITRKDIIREDNPYAGTLTFDFKKLKLDPRERISTTIRIGSSGKWSFADKTQTFVHELLHDLGRGQKIPQGWDHQVKTEPVFNVDLEHTKRLVLRHDKLVFDNTLLVELGNIRTQLEYRTGVKIGNHIPSFIEPNSKNINIYFTFDAFNILRAHNIYYAGGIFRDSVHTVDMTHHVIGVIPSICLSYSDYKIRFSYVKKTKDYEEQKRTWHEYGLLSFGIDW